MERSNPINTATPVAKYAFGKVVCEKVEEAIGFCVLGDDPVTAVAIKRIRPPRTMIIETIYPHWTARVPNQLIKTMLPSSK